MFIIYFSHSLLQIGFDNLKVFVQFKIIDTGVGIDEEVVTKLFTMYGQASVSDYRKYGGSGIGLRLCALLVQQSMGMIALSLILE